MHQPWQEAEARLVDSLREEVSAAEARADEERREAGSARAAAAAREAQLQAGLQEAAASVATLQRGLEVRSLQWSQRGSHIPDVLKLTSTKAACEMPVVCTEWRVGPLIRIGTAALHMPAGQSSSQLQLGQFAGLQRLLGQRVDM